MKYSFSGRVRYSEIGENGLLTLPGVLNYFQDCSTFQSEEVGLGISVLKDWKRFWVLSAWQVIVAISGNGRGNQNIYLGVWIPWIYGLS